MFDGVVSYTYRIYYSLIPNTVFHLGYPFVCKYKVRVMKWKSMPSAFFWDITQRYRGNSLPTFRDNLSVPSSRVKKYKKNVCFFLYFFTIRCVTSQKSADLVRFAN